MKQGTIDFESPLARGSDARTSQEAADAAVESGLVAGHERAIVAAVKAIPWRTGDEIGVALGLTNVQVLRRTRSLERRGLIQRGDARPSRITGRPALTWGPVIDAA